VRGSPLDAATTFFNTLPYLTTKATRDAPFFGD
jgi:hypothetical protein